MKQVIIIRKDLKMRRGKECAQACHASMKATLENMDHPHVKAWLADKFTKVVVSVDSEDELHAVYKAALGADLVCSLIKDAGLTEFGGVATYTAVAVGPGPHDKIDMVTGDLRLL